MHEPPLSSWTTAEVGVASMIDTPSEVDEGANCTEQATPRLIANNAANTIFMVSPFEVGRIWPLFLYVVVSSLWQVRAPSARLAGARAALRASGAIAARVATRTRAVIAVDEVADARAAAAVVVVAQLLDDMGGRLHAGRRTFRRGQQNRLYRTAD
jgi:hypothetical protein